MDIALQAWGGGFYLVNKILFAFAEGKKQNTKRLFKIYCNCKSKKIRKNITLCDGEVFAVKNGKKKLTATMTGTMMSIANRKGFKN